VNLTAQPSIRSPQPTLRVGFDGRDLLRKRTGMVNYAVHLAQRLARRDDAELVVYADSFVDPVVKPPSCVPLRRLTAPPIAWKHLALPLALRRDRVALFHSPTGTLPLWAPCKQVVTIHDLFAEVEPRWFPPRMALQLRRAQRRAACSAAAVIAVSENTRHDIVERYGVPPERVHVVNNGIDHTRFRPPDGEADLDGVAARYDVRRPFILCVGSLLPWRNAPRLLRAAAELRRRHKLDHHLLFVGRDIWGTDPTAAIARENGWDAWAKFPGYIGDEDLPLLYWAADVFAYPSLYEGFGIPPVEAMACGTPVVASIMGSLPEVCGDAALLVDPRDEQALAGALYKAMSDTEQRVHLRARGLARAARYSLDREAEETWRVYQSVAA
jgi:glycosyltransferase involved in cell wall biosynthesis